MTIRRVLFFCFLMCSLHGYANTPSPFNLGQRHVISSEHLNSGSINYSVHLPASYATSDKHYPVLFVLDGKMHFPSAVAVQYSLGGEFDIPEMIIVGLENSYPQREHLVWQQKEKFAAFLAHDMLPLIDKTYRTKPERLIFGWEMGSYFASYLLLHDSQLFDGAIAANGGFVNADLINGFSQSQNNSHRYLYLANSVQDIFTVDRTRQAADVLTQHRVPHLTWKLDWFDDETHASVPYIAMFHGLRFFYHDYRSYQFHSIAQYQAFGGIPALEKYYQQRANRFGFSPDIDDACKNTLIWLAWKRDNFEYFDIFMTEFNDVLDTQRYQSEYWQHRLGQFYLKYKKYDEALTFFNRAIEKFTPTPRVYKAIADVMLAKNDTPGAIAKLEQAVELARKVSDSQLSDYQQQLAQWRMQ